MFTKDRINLILAARGLEADCCTRPHDILDMLDDIAGVDTKGGLQYAILSCRKISVNGVGARVRQHEQLISKPPPLVTDECTCGCC